MEDRKAQIRTTEYPESDCQFQEWHAHIVEGEKFSGKVRPGIYLVSVRGDPPNFFVLPVSPYLLDLIRQEAKRAKCEEEVCQLTSGAIRRGDYVENFR